MNITTHELQRKIGIVISVYKFSPDYMDINYNRALSKIDGMEMLIGPNIHFDLARNDIEAIHGNRVQESAA